MKLEQATSDDSFIPKSLSEFQKGNWGSSGKMLITSFEYQIILVQNIKGLSSDAVNSNNLFFLRIRHIPFQYKTKKVVFKETMNYDQKIFMFEWKLYFSPISDHFFPIEFDVLTISHTGWLSEHKKEDLIGTCKLSMADLIDFSRVSVAKLVSMILYQDSSSISFRKDWKEKGPAKSFCSWYSCRKSI